MNALTIGELARQASVNRETVRYYERRRLLPLPERTVSGYRSFSDDAVRRIIFIRRAQALGFSLNEIRELLELRVDRRTGSMSVRARAEAKIRIVEEKVQALTAMKRTLSRLAAACAKGSTTHRCPILEGFEAKEQPVREEVGRAKTNGIWSDS